MDLLNAVLLIGGYFWALNYGLSLGMIFAFVDIRFFLLINGMSFLLSALSEYFINLKVSKDSSSQAEENPIESMKSGISYLKNSKLILGLIGVFVIFNFSFGFSVVVPLPYIINNVLQLSPTAYGNIQAFLPLGMIIGALVINLLSKTLKYEQILMLTSIGVVITAVKVVAPIAFLSSGFFLNFIPVYIICFFGGGVLI